MPGTDYHHLGGEFWRSAESVYYAGAKIRLDAQRTRVCFGTWASDEDRVYMGPFWIKRADASTFEALNTVYAKDEKQCFASPAGITNVKVVKRADVESFQPLDSGLTCCPAGLGPGNLSAGYACDRSNVYYNGNRIVGADRESFLALGDEFSRDRQGVYWEGVALPSAKPSRWRRLEGDYSCDDTAVYWRSKKLDVACLPERFHFVGGLGGAYGFDGEAFFANGGPCPESQVCEVLTNRSRHTASLAESIQSGEWQSIRRKGDRSFREPDPTEFLAREFSLGESEESVVKKLGEGQAIPLDDFGAHFDDEPYEWGEPCYTPDDRLVRYTRGRHEVVVWYSEGRLKGFNVDNNG